MAVHQPRTSSGPSGPLFWLLFALGWGVMLFGLWGVFDESNRTHPDSFGLWFIGSAIVHDALVAPAVVAVGVAVVRAVPGYWRRFVQAALLVSGSVLAVALPLLLGLGGQAGNASALPRNYVAGSAIVLAVVWVIAGGIGLVLKRRARGPNA